MSTLKVYYLLSTYFFTNHTGMILIADQKRFIFKLYFSHGKNFRKPGY